MPRNAEETRRRILDAAIEEFAAHGLAGGRVERIATRSGANPRSIYVYYGSKDGLFRAAVHEVFAALGRAVPLTTDDLPGWAGRTFDWIVAHPESVRINMWRNLEAPDAGPDDTEVYAAAVAELGDQHPLPAADLLVFVANLAAAWVTTSRDLRAADGSDPTSRERLAAHRAALVEAVRLLTGSARTGV